MFSKIKTAVVAFAAPALLMAGSAYAALPAAVDTAITEYGTDGKTALTALLVAGAGIWVIKKVGQKLGFF